MTTPDNQSTKTTCITCNTELEKEIVILNFSTEPNQYCPNPKCARYGLVTVVSRKVKNDEPV